MTEATLQTTQTTAEETPALPGELHGQLRPPVRWV